MIEERSWISWIRDTPIFPLIHGSPASVESYWAPSEFLIFLVDPDISSSIAGGYGQFHRPPVAPAWYLFIWYSRNNPGSILRRNSGNSTAVSNWHPLLKHWNLKQFLGSTQKSAEHLAFFLLSFFLNWEQNGHGISYFGTLLEFDLTTPGIVNWNRSSRYSWSISVSSFLLWLYIRTCLFTALVYHKTFLLSRQYLIHLTQHPKHSRIAMLLFRELVHVKTSFYTNNYAVVSVNCIHS